MSRKNPRTPSNEQEAFAMGFMSAYTGVAGGWTDLDNVLPTNVWNEIPYSISDELRHAWKQGIDKGQTFYMDHCDPDDEEEVSA